MMHFSCNIKNMYDRSTFAKRGVLRKCITQEEIIMKKRVEKTGYICIMLLCMGVTFGCAHGQDAVAPIEQPDTVQSSTRTEEQQTEKESTVQQTEAQTADQDAYTPERQLSQNKQFFYEEAERQRIDRNTAEACLQTLINDNIFQDGAMALTGLRIDDIDGNGQPDMLAMVLDAQEKPFYGDGGLWFYMNEDEPYCFSEEMCSYYGWFDVFWDDIDNDENVEIVFSAQGTGCGAVGDSYKAVFKYRNQPDISSEKNYIERILMPSDYEEDYDCGLHIDVIQEPEAEKYSAYCPYFDEKISFRAPNIEGWDLPSAAEVVGGNARGFYNLRVAEYEGKKALQASEYLYGEGGTADFVGTAQFLIIWKEDGTSEVVKWWIDEVE